MTAEKKNNKKSEAGKGDAPRPFSISQKKFAKRWELIFGKKKKRKKKNV